MGQKKNWRLHLETVCLQGKKKKKGAIGECYKLLSSEDWGMRIIQDSWEGTFIYLTSGSLAQIMYHFKSYFSVKEITSIFAHSH